MTPDNGTGVRASISTTAAPRLPETVIIINDFCHIEGGASKVAVDEAVCLAASGRRVIFLGAVGPVCDELLVPGIEVVCLGQERLANFRTDPSVALQGMWNSAAYRRMGALLEPLSASTTVAHLHGFTRALSASPVRATHNAGVPIVYTMHDFFIACPNGAFFNYPQGEPCQKTALSAACLLSQCDKRHPLHKGFRLVRAIAQRRLGGLPRSVLDYVALSHRSAELLSPYLPRGARVTRLDNPIDLPYCSPVPAANNRAIICVGRLDIEKGVGILAQAAKIAGVSITFVGDGPLRPEVERLGATVTGWLSSREVLAKFESARCLVFPSIWYETYGLSVSEAAARGVPAIVSDISAAAERVVHGVTGWHFRSGDTASLARALAHALDDSKIATAGAAAYSRFWMKPPTRANHLAGLLTIYAAALSGGDIQIPVPASQSRPIYTRIQSSHGRSVTQKG